MTWSQRVTYSLFAAEQVIRIFDEAYPQEQRPRRAIGAAYKCLTNPIKENKEAAATAASAAYAAASAAYAAASATAVSAAYAAVCAAYAASYTTNTVANVAYAADAAANAVNAVVNTARFPLQKKIITFGIRLMKETYWTQFLGAPRRSI